ncbi:MAG: hypothetical protein N3F66_02300 [Spirochaetes bacterium]|nr:hypothetical protein [Spirochaetota bacterium]
MAHFKLDGAKFETLEELKEVMWQLYKDKMSREEFETYVEQNVQKTE